MATTGQHYFYHDDRLKMSLAARFIVRLISYCAYGIATVGAIVLWSSDVSALHAAGALILLFLMSRLFALNKPERSLVRLSVHHPNAAEYLAPQAYRLIEAAVDRVALHGGDVELHLLKILVKEEDIKRILVRLDIDYGGFTAKIDGYLTETMRKPKMPKDKVLATIEQIVVGGLQRGAVHYGTAIKSYYLFGAFGSSSNEYIKRLFTLFNIATEDIETAFLFGKGRKSHIRRFVHGALKSRHRVMNRAWTARPTPVLDEYGSDITDYVRERNGWVLVGHEKEYGRLINVLTRPGSPNALLVGEPGSGKTAMVYNLAFQVIKDRVPAALFDHRLVALSLSGLSAGAEAAELSKRFSDIVREVVAAGNIILCIPDLHLLLTNDKGSRIPGADILLAAIKSGTFSVIATTYPKEYKQYIEQNNEIASIFEPIRVEELPEGEAVRYLVYAALVLEAESKIVITFKAIKEAVRIAHKYFRNKPLPSSAEDLLKEAIAGAALRKDGVLNPDDVIATAEQKVNIKMHAVQEGEAEQLLHLEESIHEKFVDQEEAVKAVADALRAYRAGVVRKGGPIASFLFCGPTGVGKTELAKLVAQTQFGSREAMVRFDMTEYQDKQSFYRLIGSPDGSMRGSLTEAVMEKPYSLILLDEFEKAYPDILNLFLQVLDDGRLTDNFGRTVDFQNTIIIATSNAHSTLIQEELGKQSAVSAITDLLKKRLVEYFKPELINRFSQVVIFKPLSEKDIRAVAKLNLADLARTLAEAQAVTLNFEDSALDEIARRGYDPLFGARPLRQAINDALRSILADKILRREIKRGDTIDVRFDGAFVFERRSQ